MKMYSDCNWCIYQGEDFTECRKQGVCQGPTTSIAIEHIFHEFSFEDMQKWYKYFKSVQLTELMVLKSIICQCIREREEYDDGEEN